MVGVFGVLMQAKRFDVVNFLRFTEVGFMQSAALAYAAVALVCLRALGFPFWAVIVFVSAAPGIAILSSHVVGLPLTHAGTAAEIAFFDFCVFALELFAAIVTMQYLASLTEHRLFAFVATSDGRCFLPCLGVGAARGCDSVS